MPEFLRQTLTKAFILNQQLRLAAQESFCLLAYSIEHILKLNRRKTQLDIDLQAWSPQTTLFPSHSSVKIKLQISV